jgi:anthranilate phosphoribosyltransferase
MVHGDIGLDEISTIGTTSISELRDGSVVSYSLDAHRDLGLKVPEFDELAAGDSPAENAKILEKILRGKDTGPRKDIACLNAAGVLVAAGVVDDLANGFKRANELVVSGASADVLERLRQVQG